MKNTLFTIAAFAFLFASCNNAATNNETPKTTQDPKLKKGDHFVGHYYVKFNEIYEEQINQSKDLTNEIIESILY